MQLVAGAMACDLLGSAILSNHFQLVVRNQPDLMGAWSNDEVARRWYRLCPLRREADGSPGEPTEGDLGMITNNPDRLSEIRRRLTNPSWLMRFLTEPIARRANVEDSRRGRF